MTEQEFINKWFATNGGACDPLTIGAPASSEEYLRNRLTKALIDGIDIGRQLQLDADVRRLQEVLTKP